MSRVIINKKDGTKEILENVDDIDYDKDKVEIYFKIPTKEINRGEIKSVYHEYTLFGIKQVERIL